MFLDCLELIFDNLAGVISAFNVKLFSLGGTDVTFWELLLSLLTVSVIFGFFLRPRAGSGLGSIGNLVGFGEKGSYESYADNRSRNESYSARYVAERNNSGGQ